MPLCVGGRKLTPTYYAIRPFPSPSQHPEEPTLLDDDLIRRTLATALRTGGDFAEVFVEDKRSSSARLDDGKVEELSSGRDRGAGIRVVVGDTTGFAHTADLSESGLTAAAGAAAAAADAAAACLLRNGGHRVGADGNFGGKARRCAPQL